MLMKSCKLLLKVGLTTILVALIFLCCVIGKINVYAADISTYSANDRAEMKGFTLNNLGYGTDWSKEAVSILDYGTMSLWIAQFTTPDPDKQRARYVTVLVEARLSANGKTGYGTFNNDLMDIEIGRKLDTNTSIVCYAPIQTDSQYTVTESFGASAGTGSGLSIGYSYQTSKTYSDISFTNYTNRKEFEGMETLSKEFKYDFMNSESSSGGVSPYAGEIIQRLSVTFYADYSTGGDSDNDTYVIKFIGKINKLYGTPKEAAITVRIKSGMFAEVDESELQNI